MKKIYCMAFLGGMNSAVNSSMKISTQRLLNVVVADHFRDEKFKKIWRRGQLFSFSSLVALMFVIISSVINNLDNLAFILIAIYLTISFVSIFAISIFKKIVK